MKATGHRRNWVIDPTGRLGPLMLGQEQDDVLSALGRPTEKSSDQGMEFLGYPDLTAVLDRGRVSMLIAEPTYAGQTVHGFGVNTPVARVLELVGDVWYDEAQALWRFAGGGHVFLEIVRPPRAAESPIDAPYVVEAYKLLDPERALVRRIYLI